MNTLSRISIAVITLLLLLNSPLQAHVFSVTQDTFERKGPANKPISIFEQIESDYDFKNDFFDIININSQVFEDENPKSGFYYFFPKEYQLSWSSVSGHSLQTNYMSADESGKGKVIVTLKLEPNISNDDKKLAEALVKNAIKNLPGKKFTSLQSIPLGETSKISFKRLEGYIDARDVDITVPNDLLDPIVLTLKTEKPDDLLTLLFTDVGLRGDLTITPAGSVPAQVIPVTIKFDYHKTFGTNELNPLTWRTDGWQNFTGYPVVMKNLHVMRMEIKNGKTVPVIYTWELGDKLVAENSKAKFDGSLVPTWLDADKKVKKMWVEYLVKPCDECNIEVRSNLPNSTIDKEISIISFEIGDPLEFTGAARIKLKVRSTQLDPTGTQKVERNPPYNVTQDGISLENFQLFVPRGKKASFEYQLSLIMKDGDIKTSGWVSNLGKTEIGIGRKFIQEQFPEYNKTGPKPKKTSDDN